MTKNPYIIPTLIIGAVVVFYIMNNKKKAENTPSPIIQPITIQMPTPPVKPVVTTDALTKPASPSTATA